jgi:D-glycero-D-manno-heptose 1,7-bisphosphate phosphatase
MNRAIFIDRDGTLNEMVYDDTHGLMDSPRRANQVRMIPGAGAFLRAVRALGYRVIVVTNQPGRAKGTLTPADLREVEEELARQLAIEGGAWDDMFVCPHHPVGSAGGVAELVRACSCRKPAPGLLLEAARKHDVDLTASWMIGDGLNDMQAGRRAGVRTVLVTNLKLEQIGAFIRLDCQPDYVLPSLGSVWGVISRSPT